MNIVILDEVELNEMQQRRLETLGTVMTYSDNPSDPNETVRRLKDAEIAILGWTTIDDTILSQTPVLKMISVWATGYNYVDVVAARQRGVTVTNVPSYAGVAVAEFALGLMISAARHIPQATSGMLAGGYSWKPFQGIELRGRTVGVVGTGDIGGHLCRVTKGLGMRVLAYSRTMNQQRSAEIGCEYVKMSDLLAHSDFVSLHVPLTEETRQLIREEELQAMKSSAFLINTTRADVLDQNALKTALKDRVVAGAALDEIHLPDDELLALPNVIVTPHMAFYTQEALVRKGDTCVANVAAFIGGVPTNIVNG
jgi:phosphoglycerate dehydrogenase-like enzyme